MLVIVPRHRADEYDALSRVFGDIPDCRVIFDRRVAERRRVQHTRYFNERRRRQRRSDRLDNSQGLVVVFLC